MSWRGMMISWWSEASIIVCSLLSAPLNDSQRWLESRQWTDWTQESSSVRVDSNENITLRFLQHQKESILRILKVRIQHLRSSLSALLIHVYRSKLSKNSSLRLFIQMSSAIASIIEGFSFAYLQEAFVIALLSIVQTQRANLIKPDASEISTSDDLASNSVWQAISKQVQTLRKEMKDSRKSVQDAEKNSMLSDARSSFTTSTGFGLSR